jgi:cation:H+ antiporter
MELSGIWTEFGLCLGLIAWAGTRLIREADAIASLTGMSRHWIGMTLVATVTSLPELVTGATAVLGAQAPALATGDALGSCVLNLALLAVLEWRSPRGALFASAAPAHRVSALVGAALLALVALEMAGAVPRVAGGGAWGLASGVTVLAYAAVLAVGRRGAAVATAPAGDASAALPPGALRQALLRAAVSSAVIVAAGVRLPFVGVALGDAMGWSTSFVGSLFLATATSAPEMVTTWAAWRAGALDMAIGSLLGSNLFDLLVLAFDDLLWTRGPILHEVPGTQAATALTAAAMSALVALAVGRRLRPVVGGASAVGVALALLYLLHLAMLARWAT